jgi:hypothetical protein
MGSEIQQEDGELFGSTTASSARLLHISGIDG